MNIKKIEKKWEKIWRKKKIFEANVKNKPKFFITWPYPYVNGSMHIGHAFSAFRCDSYARFKRMQGFNVLYPQGFHATGEPIVGSIERVKLKDSIQIETFKTFGATDKDIKNFIEYGPEFVAKFWMKRWIEDLKIAGFSIDWRRTFITTKMNPTYSRFIEWQYNTLRKMGYVYQGTHPVIWCPKCKSPTGDHDRLEGIGESPVEHLIIKFSLDDKILPTATLRPETVFGVTNIWVNPDVKYCLAEVDGEKWILSEGAVEKLRDQLKNVSVKGELKGEDLIGKYAENPVLKEKVPILPAKFVDPNFGTGIVMSVPSHAPYDWIGIEDLKNSGELKKYGTFDIKPITVIKTEGFGENPAEEICRKIGIKSQDERKKLDEATSIIYKKEFHLGILNDRCGKYAGFKVSEIKERLYKEFFESGIAEKMWEPSAPVICRCTTPNHVKILENQWFLRYSDEKWKEKVRKLIKKMKFYPEEVRTQFENTVEWLKDKACTRKTGLGTNLPWDKEWIIETLSDSVIYPAYYTIARIINERKIEAEKLTDDVFDYIFLGKGNSKVLSKKVGIDKKILDEMRREFDYFYPVDLRNSGKDLVQNHLTFYLFHHVAIWKNQKYWPRGIGVNGYVQVGGEKMSKSKGNIIPIRKLINEFGSDLVRINLIASNEGLNDADWVEENLSTYISRINFLESIVSNVKKATRKNVEKIDLFLRSKLQLHIKLATENYEELKFRSAAQCAFFDLTNDLKWYIERNGGIKNCNRKVLLEFLNIGIKLFTPLLPHVCEELWEKLGNKKIVCIEKWPKYNPKEFKKEVVELEEILKKFLQDLNEIIKLKGKKRSAYLYFSTKKELEYFREAVDFIKKKFEFEKLKLFISSDPKRYDPENRAERAKYGKPGIYLE
ncbi:MAG: leucine--tRNA ligase [Candidatus Aenigmatarchaeota archaeon]